METFFPPVPDPYPFLPIPNSLLTHLSSYTPMPRPRLSRVPILLVPTDPRAPVLSANKILGPRLRASPTPKGGLLQTRILAHLPLAHIYGFVIELLAMYWGSVIGYARFRTLLRGARGLRRECRSDFEVFGAGFLASYAPLFPCSEFPCSACLLRFIAFVCDDCFECVGSEIRGLIVESL